MLEYDLIIDTYKRKKKNLWMLSLISQDKTQKMKLEVSDQFPPDTIFHVTVIAYDVDENQKKLDEWFK